MLAIRPRRDPSLRCSPGDIPPLQFKRCRICATRVPQEHPATSAPTAIATTNRRHRVRRITARQPRSSSPNPPVPTSRPEEVDNHPPRQCDTDRPDHHPHYTDPRSPPTVRRPHRTSGSQSAPECNYSDFHSPAGESVHRACSRPHVHDSVRPVMVRPPPRSMAAGDQASPTH